VDGIFGPRTARAVADFQRNVGLNPDGICGYESVQALRRLGDRIADGRSVASVREEDRLRHDQPGLGGLRVVIGQFGGLGALARAVAMLLRAEGAIVITLDEPDESVQAATANRFGADVYLGLRASAYRSGVAYYATVGFESAGGRQLASLLHPPGGLVGPMTEGPSGCGCRSFGKPACPPCSATWRLSTRSTRPYRRWPAHSPNPSRPGPMVEGR
jgi:N-acetylmuramoyl-L-alanine amidase